MDTETQWTLIRRAQGEGPEARLALNEFIQRYRGTILSLIRRRGVPRNTSAEDLLQSFLTRAWTNQHFARLDEARGSFHGWLYRAVNGHVANAWRKLKTDPTAHAVVPDDGDNSDALHSSALDAPRSETPEDAYLAEFVSDTLQHALNFVRGEFSESFDAYEPFLLRQAVEDNQGEVAKRLGVTRTMFATRLHRMRLRWKKMLDLAFSETAETGDTTTQRVLWDVLKARSRGTEVSD